MVESGAAPAADMSHRGRSHQLWGAAQAVAAGLRKEGRICAISGTLNRFRAGGGVQLRKAAAEGREPKVATLLERSDAKEFVDSQIVR